MSSPAQRSRWQRFRALPRDSVTKTLGLAFLVAFVSGVVVTSISVLLQPKQQAHLDAARAESLLSSLRSIPGIADVLADADASTLRLRLVDLQTGEFTPSGDVESFDELAEAVDPATSIAIPRDLDEAGIGRRAKLAAVYVIGAADKPDLVVLPIYGLGYQSMLRAFVVLANDLNTIAAFTIYAHAETAGLGSRIGDPDWQQRFRGKKAFAADGSVALRITPRGAEGVHEVDGIGGATRSTTGVANMLKFWLGPNGYGRFLTRLKEARGSEER